ncbi:MAG: lipid II:glycine glycyltransferase FemX [Patescibacteria group bacterium]
MKINSIQDKEQWDDYLKANNHSFTQSIDWGDFKSKNQRVERIEAREDGELIGVCQFLEENNPFGEYFYIPYGPVGKNEKVRENLLKEVVKIGEKEGKTFVKAEPTQKITTGKSTHHRIQPKKTLVRDITDDPEQILNSFKENTRYSVRYSKRKGVTIKKSENEEDLEEFFELLEKTEDRQDFNSFSKKYFKDLLNTIDSNLFLAVSKEEDVVASTIFGYFGKTATSLHSAFDYSKRKLRATSLIRFEAIKEAKRKGCIKFDSWGIDEEKMPGVTKFKKGFGGEPVEYPKARDVAIKKLVYQGYNLASKIIKN